MESVLQKCGAYGATFYEIGQHAPVAGIRKGLQSFKDAGADVIVTVGGGSPVDAAKAILYLHQQETGRPTLRQIAIPTTLSAAEYTVSIYWSIFMVCRISTHAHVADRRRFHK